MHRERPAGAAQLKDADSRAPDLLSDNCLRYHPGMKAAILAVGSELLGTDRLDTNSLRLTALLSRYGVELRRKAVIGDSEGEVRLQGGSPRESG